MSTKDAGDASADQGQSGSMRNRLGAVVRVVDSPTNWTFVRADDAEERWTKLRGWVDSFRCEFGFDHRVVPPCWYLHPALVRVLSALRDQWCSAYDPLNMLTAPAAWHVTLLQLEPRLREFASRTGCTADTHRPDVVALYPDDEERWAAHLAADVEARRIREQAELLQRGPGRRGGRSDRSGDVGTAG